MDIIQSCKEGDLDAFNTLFKQYSVKAVRTVYLITGKKDISEDLVQEAFITCFKQIKKLKKPEAFEAWFYRLLTRICWRYCSKQKNNLCIDDINEKNTTSNNSLSDVTEKNEIKVLVDKALNKLSMPLKTIIVLYYYNELSIKEISDILGCFEGTVKSRLYNARKLLKKEFLTEDFEGYYFNNKDVRCNENV
ncbi:MAG: RNA polymerase sigma factor [Clostridium sp.]|nr:RNA polymerase sigma factor [Clostridium sp.]